MKSGPGDETRRDKENLPLFTRAGGQAIGMGCFCFGAAAWSVTTPPRKPDFNGADANQRDEENEKEIG